VASGVHYRFATRPKGKVQGRRNPDSGLLLIGGALDHPSPFCQWVIE